MKSLGLLGLVFDTGLIVTQLMGHLGCLASHWSVPVISMPFLYMGFWVWVWLVVQKACISAHQQRLRRCICHAHQRLIQRHIQHHAHCQYCCSKRCMSFCTFSCMHFYMQRQPDNERCLALFNGPLLCHDDLPTATPVPRQFLAKIWQASNSQFLIQLQPWFSYQWKMTIV